jgi:hypothetical protein
MTPQGKVGEREAGMVPYLPRLITRSGTALFLNGPLPDHESYLIVPVKRCHASGEMLRITPPRSVVSRTMMRLSMSAASTQPPPFVPL